jgi:hypothetical protein
MQESGVRSDKAQSCSHRYSFLLTPELCILFLIAESAGLS